MDDEQAGHENEKGDLRLTAANTVVNQYMTSKKAGWPHQGPVTSFSPFCEHVSLTCQGEKFPNASGTHVR